MNLKTFYSIAFITLAVLLPSSGYSDVNHYSNVLVGDRAATMGGAYIAVANDTSGTYYNPSGIAFFDGGGLSASVNVFHLQHFNYEKAIKDNDWVRNSSELIPNFFGIIKTFGRHSFGASIAIPDSFVQNQDQVFDNLPAMGGEAIKRYAFNLHTQDATYLIGPSYSYRISDSLAFGLTMNVHYRQNRTQNYQTVWYTSTDYESSTDIGALSEYGIAPKLGFIAKLTDKIHAGIILTHTFIAYSKYTNQSTEKPRASNNTSFNDIKVGNHRNMPTQLGLGLAFYPTEPWSLTLDCNIYFAPSADIFYPNGYTNVYNLSAGAEYRINERNAARMGLFTNKSNMPTPSKATKFVTHIDMYGVSTGYAFTYKSTAFNFGIIYSYGSGESQVYSDTYEAVNMRNHNLTGMFSTSYSFN